MKRLLIFVIIIINCFNLSAQDYVGEWKGYFTYNKGDFYVPNDKVSISLVIYNSNSGNSYTKSKDQYGLDTTYTQKIKVEQIGKDSLKISEVNEVNVNDTESMQIMYLRIIRKSTFKMTGRWESTYGVAKFSGEMNLTKQ